MQWPVLQAMSQQIWLPISDVVEERILDPVGNVLYDKLMSDWYADAEV